jgi:hypothetical protein
MNKTARKSPLAGLIMRTAVVIRPRYGFIYACDPKKEKKEIPHVIIFAWDDGRFERGDGNYDAHSACAVTAPGPGIVNVSEAGYFNVNSRSGSFTGDIFEKSEPQPEKRRSRGIRSVSEIAGKAYAVGIRGMVYRLDDLAQWSRIDMGLPSSFDAQAIHGTGESNVFSVGTAGQLWHFDGKKWTQKELPTNRNLAAVKCADDGTVFIAGHGGILLRGSGDVWEVIEQEGTDDDIWDLEFFQGKLYVSTLAGLFVLKGDTLGAVTFGRDTPRSTYQLSAAEGVMWSNGEFDVMSFDGKIWSRVV